MMSPPVWGGTFSILFFVVGGEAAAVLGAGQYSDDIIGFSRADRREAVLEGLLNGLGGRGRGEKGGEKKASGPSIAFHAPILVASPPNVNHG